MGRTFGRRLVTALAVAVVLIAAVVAAVRLDPMTVRPCQPKESHHV